MVISLSLQVQGERGLDISPWLPEDPEGVWGRGGQTLKFQVSGRVFKGSGEPPREGTISIYPYYGSFLLAI